MAKTPRVDYQLPAIDSVFDYLAKGKGMNPLIVAPVGSGKSLIQAEIMRRIHEQAPRTRMVAVTDTQELLTQNAEELVGQYPHADFGFYSASLGQKRLHNDITFAGIQSVYNKAHLFNRVPQVLFIDEAHMVGMDSESMYRKFIDKLRELNPKLVVVGLTGSPWRPNGQRLDEGENRLFDGVCYTIGIDWMIEQGYLCKPITPKVSFKMDVSGVQMRNGDYIPGQLEKAVDVGETTQAIVADTIAQGRADKRRKWLIFTAGVTHCEHVTQEFIRRGVNAKMVTGDTPKEERLEIVKWFKAPLAFGETEKVLVNVATMTKGFNEPGIDLIAYYRPTRSPILYTQTLGRGMRTVYMDGFDLLTQQWRLDAIAASGKPNCMVLDYGGVVDALGPVDALDISAPMKKAGPKVETGPITKKCPKCGAECAASQRYCYQCSYSFIDAALNDKASKSAVVSADEQPQEYAVMDMQLSLHRKKDAPDAPPTLKVTYTTLGGPFSEYVCFEHHNYPQGDPKRFAWDKAVSWHRVRKPNEKPPTSVEDAMFMLYPNPSHVMVKREGKYWRVLSCRFDYDKITAMERPDLQLEREIAERNIMFKNEGLEDSIPF